MKHIQVRGLNFAYLEQGEGPLIMLLHGFPDNAQTWSHQMPALAEQGYRVIATNMTKNPSETPITWGIDRRKPKFTPEAKSIRLFGPGVKEVAREKVAIE